MNVCRWHEPLNQVNKVSDINDQLIPESTNILNWLKKNRVSLNFIKTKSMLIGSVQKIQPLNSLISIRVNGRLIKRVKGINWIPWVTVTDENLTWNDHKDYISVKIRRNIGIWLTIPRGSLVLLYKTSIEPYFRYRISSFKCRGVLFVLALLGEAFISRIKIEENEIMCQFKAIRYFLNHAVWNYKIKM